MLSKYYELTGKHKREKMSVDMDDFILTFRRHLLKKYKNVKVIPIYPEGTLGVFFHVELDGKKKFVKTHLIGKQYQENIQKEIEIMSAIYKGKMEITFENIQVHDYKQTFMIMDYLNKPRNELTLKDVRKCIEFYDKGLAEKDFCNYKLEEVIQAGWNSIAFLDDKGFFTSEESSRVKESICYVEQRLPSLMRITCHGDLSSRNIMCDNGGEQKFAIDWEDSLLGFPEYDFLYWLTFFPQRKYYASNFLEGFKIEMPLGIHTMALITLVKCYLSYCNGSYKSNSLSFGQRLGELYNKLM